MNPSNYYRLPWTTTDNVLGWLEPTKKCNIYCEGCYSANEPSSHRTLDQVRADLDTFLRLRKVDSISIAGGDPLTHPEIVEIVRMIASDYRLKPVVNTNGVAMTPELLHELRQAGLRGVTFHVDASQGRPGWKGRSNAELGALRLGFAQMVAAEGGLTCSFNSTVFRDSVADVPEMIRWAQRHVDIVHGMVFILFRTARSAEFDYYAGGRKVEVDELVYYDQEKNPAPLTTPELFDLIRQHEPGFDAAAYLGGTHDPRSFKWTLVGRVASPDRVYGYVGKRFMEIVQTGHHLARGRYLAYSDPRLLAMGRGLLTAFAPVDAGARRAFGRWIGDVTTGRRRPGDPLYYQTIAFIQPIDMTPEGDANMCDGCPDMTVHEGRLVWSCRLDELKRHKTFLTCVPR